MGLDRLANEFKRILDAPSNDTKPYDTEAEVKRIDDNGKIAWVHIPGGYDETPVELTMNAEPQEKVKVRISGGRAWITGNSTSPPTDDKKAIRAERRAVNAEAAAENAKNSADSAKSAAELAWARAIVADEAADRAQESADSAYKSAGTALDQLSIVEDVVGVLHLLETNVNYALTEDTEVQPNKWYFIKNITDYHLMTESYSVVVDPSGNPSEQGWYELVDIKEAVQNYVTSHLALTERGLWLQTANDSTRVLLSSSEGIVLYDNTGEVAKYGQTSQIGRDSGFHMTADGQELSFYDGPTKVAYINNNQLYITKSVVLQQMDLGTPVIQGGLGQWSWKVHPTSEGNNLNLKWIG